LQQFRLSDGSALLLAVEEWLTPKGESFWHKGIEPEQVVTLQPEVTPLLPAGEKGMTAAQLHANPDLQLLKALNLLQEQVPKAEVRRTK
jgi:carboxyl-terminal processing protease